MVAELLNNQIRRKYLVVVGKFIANPRFICIFTHPLQQVLKTKL